MQRDFNVTRLGHGTPNRLRISRRRIYQSPRLDHRQANADVFATGYRSNTPRVGAASQVSLAPRYHMKQKGSAAEVPSLDTVAVFG